MGNNANTISTEENKSSNIRIEKSVNKILRYRIIFNTVENSRKEEVTECDDDDKKVTKIFEESRKFFGDDDDSLRTKRNFVTYWLHIVIEKCENNIDNKFFLVVSNHSYICNAYKHWSIDKIKEEINVKEDSFFGYCFFTETLGKIVFENIFSNENFAIGTLLKFTYRFIFEYLTFSKNKVDLVRDLPILNKKYKTLDDLFSASLKNITRKIKLQSDYKTYSNFKLSIDNSILVYHLLFKDYLIFNTIESFDKESICFEESGLADDDFDESMKDFISMLSNNKDGYIHRMESKSYENTMFYDLESFCTQVLENVIPSIKTDDEETDYFLLNEVKKFVRDPFFRDFKND